MATARPLFSWQRRRHPWCPHHRGVLTTVRTIQWLDALRRHLAGEWSELDPEDHRANERDLVNGDRLLSAILPAETSA